MAMGRWVGGWVGAAALAIAMAPSGARADDPPPPSCSGWDVDYALSASLKITDTTMGAGDGVFPVGPGSARIHYDNVNGAPGGHAHLASYAMNESVTITSRAVLWSATVTTATHSKSTAGDDGTLQGTTLTWGGPMPAYSTTGTMTCDGSLCGKFGAPPPGTSPVSIPPRSIALAPFQFGKDLKTFSMPFVLISQSDGSSSPKQTSYEAIAGREMKRTCVP